MSVNSVTQCRLPLQDPPRGDGDGKGHSEHSLTDLKLASTSSHTHTQSYRWVVILSHAVANAAVISAFSKAGFKAVLPADSSWYWSKAHLTQQRTRIKVIKRTFAYLSWLDQLPRTRRGVSFIHLNKARNALWIWMGDIMCECVCVCKCEECVCVCARTLTHVLPRLWLVGRNAVSYLSINIMFSFSGFTGFSAVLFSKAAGNYICRTPSLLCAHDLRCVYLIYVQYLL